MALDTAPPSVDAQSAYIGHRRSSIPAMALLALPLLVMAERAWAWRWMSDDGFIHLRVVRQLVSGNGPVFNVGERVEASTSPLWVFALGFADLVSPVRLEWLAVLGGIALTLTGLALATAGSRRLGVLAGHGPLFLPAGAAVVAALPPFWTFASSGLEGGMVLAWLGACLYVLGRWADSKGKLSAPGAALLGIGPLIRPELALFSLLFLGLVLMVDRRAGWGRRARQLGAALILPVGYQVFRMGYYGSPFPNPALAKEASRAWWGQGWRYLQDVNDAYVIWVPLVILALGAYAPLVRDLRAGAQRRAVWVLGAVGVGGLLHGAYVMRVGGDFMQARLLLPSVFALVAPVAVVPAKRLYLAATLVLPWALVAGLFLRSYSDTDTSSRQLVTIEDFGWGEGGDFHAPLAGDGFYYGGRRVEGLVPTQGRRSVVAFGLGFPGYGLGPDTHVIDVLALADPVTARFELERRGLPGHEKPSPPSWLLARYTRPGPAPDEDLFDRGSLGIRQLEDQPPSSFDDRIAAARQALSCPPLQDLERSYMGPLTPRRFVANLFEALPRSRLRIPVSPTEASAELC